MGRPAAVGALATDRGGRRPRHRPPGAILVSRLPGNLIGWLLAAGGFCFAGGSGATGLADYGLNVHPGSLPGAIWFAWLSQWIWAPFIGSVVLLALVYPSGRLLSARWRPVAWAAVLIIALLTLGGAFGAWPTGMFPVQNLLQIVGAAPGPMDVVNLRFGLILVLVALFAPRLRSSSSRASIRAPRSSIRARLSTRFACQGSGSLSESSSSRPATPNRSAIGRGWPNVIKVAATRFF
jgi:hypothetical protein